VIGRSALGVRLWRLLASRRPTAGTSIESMVARLARKSGVSNSELDAVIKGAQPSPEIIQELGPALDIRIPDMFVIAGLPVPPDVASAWPTSPWNVGSIVRYALEMGPEQRGRLDELVRSLPMQPRPEPAPADDYPDGPGALLLRLLKNRNIRPYNAYVLAKVGGRPYVSDATVAGLGPGMVVITPQYVTAFAHLLGYDPEDMVALTGVGPVSEHARAHPASREIATLAWNARRLSGDQLRQVLQAAREMQ
jgi:hypothetical protein